MSKSGEHSNLPENADVSLQLVAAVVPCYREREHITEVLASIGTEVKRIYVIDDFCPDGTGDMVEKHCSDPRIRVPGGRAA